MIKRYCDHCRKEMPAHLTETARISIVQSWTKFNREHFSNQDHQTSFDLCSWACVEAMAHVLRVGLGR